MKNNKFKRIKIKPAVSVDCSNAAANITSENINIHDCQRQIKNYKLLIKMIKQIQKNPLSNEEKNSKIANLNKFIEIENKTHEIYLAKWEKDNTNTVALEKYSKAAYNILVYRYELQILESNDLNENLNDFKEKKKTSNDSIKESKSRIKNYKKCP